MSNGNGGGWLGAPKKLWSSITSEVSSIFAEPHASTKDDERRVGQVGGRSLMAEFDQQLQRELSDPSRPTSPPTAAFPSPHYGQSTSSPSYPQQQQYTAQSAWNPNDASDLGLNPSLPAYQQQHLQYVAPSAQSSPYPALPGYAQPSPYPSPSVPHYSSSRAPSVPFTNGQSAAAPYYPANSGSGSSAQPSLPPASVSPHAGSAVYASTGGVGSPYPPAAYAANGVPSPASSPQPLSAPASYASPSPSYPGAPSSPAPYPSPNAPTYPAPTSVPYPSGGPYPGAPTSSYPLPGSSPYAPAPTSSAASSSSPSSGYVGPSFTSAAYSSATSPALPPPPPSNYWVTRAAQQPAQPTSRLGLGLDHVDYSDLDPRSMDFAYAQKGKPPGAA